MQSEVLIERRALPLSLVQCSISHTMPLPLVCPGHEKRPISLPGGRNMLPVWSLPECSQRGDDPLIGKEIRSW